MVQCPKCGLKNEEGRHYCLKCGADLGLKKGDIFRTKRERILREERRLLNWKLVFILVILVGLATGYLLISSRTPTEVKIATQPKVVGKISYRGQMIRMTDIECEIKDGRIVIPLPEVKDKKIVYFEYNKSGKRVPLLSYISPSGRLITATSVCEPCHSTRFYIEGEVLVCNACFTRWTLENLRGISGGCMTYPPEVLDDVVVDGDRILISEEKVKAWKPRV